MMVCSELLIAFGHSVSRYSILPVRLTFHLLAQVGAPAVPHVLHSQQVLLCVVHQQQGNARHHQLVHDAEACRHVRLLPGLEHGCCLFVQFLSVEKQRDCRYFIITSSLNISLNGFTIISDLTFKHAL